MIWLVLTATDTLYHAGIKPTGEPDYERVGPFEMVAPGCPAVLTWDYVRVGADGVEHVVAATDGYWTFDGRAFSDVIIEIDTTEVEA